MISKIGDRLIHIIAIIGSIIFFVIFVSNMVLTCTVAYGWRENVTYNFNYWWLLVLPIVLALMYVFYLNINKVSARTIYIVGSAIYIVFGAYILFNTKDFIKADSASCFAIAKRLLNNDVSVFDRKSYISMFPYQLGYVAYDMLVITLFKDVKALYILNLFYILVINYFIYRISLKLFKDETVANMTLFIEFLFLPLFFFFLFGYGTIPGLCFITIATYCFICYLNDENKLRNMLLIIILSFIACNLKQNYKIASIAMFITIFIKLMKDGLRKNLISILFGILLVFTSLFSDSVVKSIFERYYNVEIGSGVPTITYIAMGTDLNNNMRAPGWYDGSPFYDSDKFDHDYLAMKEYEKEKLVNNIESTLASPFKLFSFYTRKISSLWSEPLFQSIWSGPTNDDGKVYVNGMLLESIYNDGTVNKVLILFCKCILVIIISSSLLFSIKHLSNVNYLFFILYFIGGFIFHLFSEGKSQYTFMYVVLLVPIVGYEVREIFAYIKSKHRIAR